MKESSYGLFFCASWFTTELITLTYEIFFEKFAPGPFFSILDSVLRTFDCNTLAVPAFKATKTTLQDVR